MNRDATTRDLFHELMEGVDAMRARREGKVTLRTHVVDGNKKVEGAPGAAFFLAARKKFNVSRAVWANMLHVSPRTVEKWEQGGQVSPLAATFVELIAKYPDTIERLQSLPRRVARRSRNTRRGSAARNVSRRATAAGGRRESGSSPRRAGNKRG